MKKRNKKKIRMTGFVTILFLVSFLGYVGSMVIVKAYNRELALTESALSSDIVKISNDVANLELQVKQLDNRERILDVAEGQGLKVNQTSIVSVVVDNDAN